MPEGLRFAYMPITNPHGEITLRPILPCTLMYRGRSVPSAGLLDTGADVNVLPYSVGVALGAIWEEQKTALTLSGNLANYEARGILVSLSVADIAAVRLAFAWTRADHLPLILGQTNFFAEFDVCFFRSQSAFEIRPQRAS